MEVRMEGQTLSVKMFAEAYLMVLCQMKNMVELWQLVKPTKVYMHLVNTWHLLCVRVF